MKLFKVCVRPHLEYALVSWAPWTKGDKELLERVQRRAVGMVTNWRARTYEDRLLEVGMTSLVERRLRGDMIATSQDLVREGEGGARDICGAARRWTKD